MSIKVSKLVFYAQSANAQRKEQTGAYQSYLLQAPQLPTTALGFHDDSQLLQWRHITHMYLPNSHTVRSHIWDSVLERARGGERERERERELSLIHI